VGGGGGSGSRDLGKLLEVVGRLCADESGVERQGAAVLRLDCDADTDEKEADEHDENVDAHETTSSRLPGAGLWGRFWFFGLSKHISRIGRSRVSSRVHCAGWGNKPCARA
jgi:hypothetical protein